MDDIIIKSEFSENIKTISYALMGTGAFLLVLRLFNVGTMFHDSDIANVVRPIVGGAFVVIGLLILWYAGSCSITVESKRVYGKAAFGKIVNIPLDSISAVGASSLFKRITVSSASGVVSFAAIKNYDKIYQELSKLTVERQK